MKITDKELEEEWNKFSNTPVDEDDNIDEDYTVGIGKQWQTSWPKGTDREEIWYWYDEHHSIGVYKLMRL